MHPPNQVTKVNIANHFCGMAHINCMSSVQSWQPQKESDKSKLRDIWQSEISTLSKYQGYKSQRKTDTDCRKLKRNNKQM